MYESLTVFERALARFGDKVGLIAGLEISDKMSPEDAYQEIKELYKELSNFFWHTSWVLRNAILFAPFTIFRALSTIPICQH